MKFLVENAPSDFNLLSEEVNGQKFLFIEGIFAQAEKKNRNGRIYPKKVMESAIGKYVNDYVKTGRAISELSHPENRPMPKPEMASHLITSLKFEGNDVYGKAKILNTPQGNIVRGLLEGGVQMGVSTRGLGSLQVREGTSYVSPDYVITAIDVVSDPSAIDAWVDAVNESCEWLVLDDGRVIESVKNKIKKEKLTEERKFQLMTEFFDNLR